MTPHGEGVIVDKETNRVEDRYGVQLDYTDQYPWGVEEEGNLPYPNNKIVYYFKSEIKIIKNNQSGTTTKH